LGFSYFLYYCTVVFFPEVFDEISKTEVMQTVSLYFVLGSLSYMVSRQIKLQLVWALALVCLPFVFLETKLFKLFFAITLIYWVFYLAYIPAGFIRAFNRLGDYSYGIYVYGFIVQQIIVSLVPGVSLDMMVLLSLFGTLPLAVMSWHVLEKPMLAYAKKKNYLAVEKHNASKDDEMILPDSMK